MVKYNYVVTLTDNCLVDSYKTVSTSRIEAVRTALTEYKRKHGRWANTGFSTITVVPVSEAS